SSFSPMTAPGRTGSALAPVLTTNSAASVAADRTMECSFIKVSGVGLQGNLYTRRTARLAQRHVCTRPRACCRDRLRATLRDERTQRRDGPAAARASGRRDNPRMGHKHRVVVGLSGGVDSAVSAHLLQRQGHEVVGVFMKNWEGDDDDEYCSSNVDFVDA